ncbi:hypothetical protein FB107DRAFT_280771 [Schizophyllum commune]
MHARCAGARPIENGPARTAARATGAARQRRRRRAREALADHGYAEQDVALPTTARASAHAIVRLPAPSMRGDVATPRHLATDLRGRRTWLTRVELDASSHCFDLLLAHDLLKPPSGPPRALNSAAILARRLAPHPLEPEDTPPLLCPTLPNRCSCRNGVADVVAMATWRPRQRDGFASYALPRRSLASSVMTVHHEAKGNA